MENEQTTQEKTFTQDEVNQIVQERLFKERKKYGEVDIDALKASEASLKAQIDESVAKLTAETERADALKAELDSIKKSNEIRDIRVQQGLPAHQADSVEETAHSLDFREHPKIAPVPSSSRREPTTISERVNPSPIPSPSSTERPMLLRLAKASALPRIMQFTVMSCKNTPSAE